MAVAESARGRSRKLASRRTGACVLRRLVIRGFVAPRRSRVAHQRSARCAPRCLLRTSHRGATEEARGHAHASWHRRRMRGVLCSALRFGVGGAALGRGGWKLFRVGRRLVGVGLHLAARARGGARCAVGAPRILQPSARASSARGDLGARLSGRRNSVESFLLGSARSFKLQRPDEMT